MIYKTEVIRTLSLMKIRAKSKHPGYSLRFPVSLKLSKSHIMSDLSLSWGSITVTFFVYETLQNSLSIGTEIFVKNSVRLKL